MSGLAPAPTAAPAAAPAAARAANAARASRPPRVEPAPVGLAFERPAALQAGEPPEARGLQRDEVRLLVSGPDGHHHATFRELDAWLEPGDLLVANDSATLPASLPARAPFGDFRLNLSTRFGPELWLAEPRWSASEPGPLPLAPGDVATLALPPGAPPVTVRFVAPHPSARPRRAAASRAGGLERLWFVQLRGDPEAAMRLAGEPIRYGYLRAAPPLGAYQTVFGRRPGSAEMPSAGRPFSRRLLRALRRRGVGVATVTLHTGVSSLEAAPDEDPALLELGAEPFAVPAATAEAIERTRAAGGRVVAVGTTVVRALASARTADGRARAARGFTRRVVTPHAEEGKVPPADGLVTGFHDPGASHLALLTALAGRELVMDGYREALAAGYLWHEFGDAHLLLPRRRT